MKTVDINNGVDLKNGIHLNAIFGSEAGDWEVHYDTSITPSGYLRNYSHDIQGYDPNDENQNWPIVPFSNSQCSQILI